MSINFSDHSKKDFVLMESYLNDISTLTAFIEKNQVHLKTLSQVEQFSAIVRTLSFTKAPLEIPFIKTLSFQFCPIPSDFGQARSFICPSTSNAILEQIFQHLEAINLNGCTNLTDESMKMLSTSKILKVACIRSLSMYWVPQITNEGISYLFGSSRVFENVEDLNLSGMHNLSSISVEIIARKCNRLKYLDLTKITKVSDKSLKSLALHCKQLESLNLFACCGFTDEGVIAIAENCITLKSIDMAGSKITDRSIESLTKNCPLLESLQLRWCVLLTDRSFLSIGMYCKNLTTLVVFGIKNLTDKGMESLSRGKCKSSILRIDLNGCSGIQHKTLEKVQQILPNVIELLPMS